jgi:hypothetical protein
MGVGLGVVLEGVGVCVSGGAVPCVFGEVEQATDAEEEGLVEGVGEGMLVHVSTNEQGGRNIYACSAWRIAGSKK